MNMMTKQEMDAMGMTADQFDWRSPDGRQMAATLATSPALSANTLAQLGITPGDIGEFWRQALKNSGMVAGGMVKAASTMERQGEEDTWMPMEDAREAEARQFQKQEAEAEDRREKAQFDEQKRTEAERLEEQRRQEEFDAKKRAENEEQNKMIMKSALGFLGFFATLKLGEAAMAQAGAVFADGTTGLGDQMMVTGDGDMLAEARGLTGMENPMAQDMQVTGPNQVASFVPGAAAAPANPVTQMANTLKAQQQMAMNSVPGLTGPSFGPGS